MLRITLPCALLSLFVSFGTAFAQEALPATEVNPARDRIKQSIEFISSQPSYGADIAMDFKISATTGESNDTALTAHIDMSGSDLARFKVNVEEGAMELFLTPEARYIYLEAQNQYLDGLDFGDRQEALTLMPGREYRPAQILLSDFLHGDLTLLQQAKTIEFVEQADAKADTPDQIRIDADGLIIDFWIQKGEAPLPTKFSMDLSSMASQGNPAVASAVVNYNLTNWNLSPDFSEDHFTFKIPEGATELQRNQPQQTGAVEGRPAPALKLELLGSEGSLDLAEHRGKNIVILDFWASWCGPCRIGLPIVSEVSEQFKEKGVVFYAVNIGEGKVKAQAFIEQTGLTATVALDTKGTAQRDYGADSIPLTVIIDREGMIHEVHRGVSPTLKMDLTRTLTKLTQ